MKTYEEITVEIIKFDLYSNNIITDVVTASKKINDDQYGEPGSDWDNEE